MGLEPGVFGRLAENNLLQLVLLAAMLGQRSGQAGTALLAKIPPHIVEWQVPFGPRGWQRRPDMVSEFGFVDREPPKGRLVAGRKGLENGMPDRFRRFEGLLQWRRTASRKEGQHRAAGQ